MLRVLEKFGLGEQFISWVDMIYRHPSSSILTNQDRSAPFFLHRGTRQGCPLSPLLFAISIEPLAIAIRNEPSIDPVRLGNIKHYISLYADDVVLFLSNPERSVPVLLDVVRSFGEISGYTINWQKSEFVALTTNLDVDFLKVLPFKITDRSKYLGVTLPKDPKLIFKLNYLEQVEKLKIDVEKWRVLPISMVGRINVIKMVSLPKFLYLFLNLPIFLNKQFFKVIDSVVLPFVWGFKTHRISKVHLCKSKLKGGFALPVFQFYYWAANARTLAYWQEGYKKIKSADTPPWVVIESGGVENSSLPALLFSSSNSRTKVNNFIVSNCVKIFSQIKKGCGLPDTSIHTPIYGNHAFPPSCLDASFDIWTQKGIITLKDLYIDRQFASFTQLQNKFSLPASHFFHYLQIRNYVRQSIANFPSLPEEGSIFTLLLSSPDSKKLVSGFVKAFSEYLNSKSDFLKMAWEEELGLLIGDEVWERSLCMIHSCSINARHQLIQFKVLHRLHYSKTKLHRIFPSISSICDRCKLGEGSLTHLFWTCPKLYHYWLNIFNCFSDIYNCTLEPDPIIALFGSSSSLLHLSSAAQTTVLFGMVIAKKIILTLWKTDIVPQFKMWLTELTALLHMERIRYILADKLSNFFDVWQPFLDHVLKQSPI
ncbi:unnamed protein product [Oreochromis niloticus]|nr:unnamed protein product [Mustela putorius furo]